MSLGYLESWFYELAQSRRMLVGNCEEEYSEGKYPRHIQTTPSYAIIATRSYQILICRSVRQSA